MCIDERVCVRIYTSLKTYSTAKRGAEDSTILGQDEDGLDLFEVPQPLEGVVDEGGRRGRSGGGCGGGCGVGAGGGHDGWWFGGGTSCCGCIGVEREKEVRHNYLVG